MDKHTYIRVKLKTSFLSRLPYDNRSGVVEWRIDKGVSDSPTVFWILSRELSSTKELQARKQISQILRLGIGRRTDDPTL